MVDTVNLNLAGATRVIYRVFVGCTEKLNCV